MLSEAMLNAQSKHPTPIGIPSLRTHRLFSAISAAKTKVRIRENAQNWPAFAFPHQGSTLLLDPCEAQDESQLPVPPNPLLPVPEHDSSSLPVSQAPSEDPFRCRLLRGILAHGPTRRRCARDERDGNHRR